MRQEEAPEPAARGESVPEQASAKPRLSYKYQRLRERLREAIRTGELTGRLPGERELAQRYGVNAKTVSKALTDLTSEGLLQRQVGRGTFVAGQLAARTAVGRRRRFRLLSGERLHNGRHEQMYRRVAERLHGEGHDVRHDLVPTDAAGRLPEQWIPPGELRGVDGVMIFSTLPEDGLVADLHRRRIPLVLSSTSAGTIKANAVIPDAARGAFELTEHLIMLGHRLISLVIGDVPCTVAPVQAIRGYHAAMMRYHLNALPTLKTPAPSLDGPETETTAVVYFGPKAEGMRSALAQHQGRPVLATLCAVGDAEEQRPQELWYGFDVDRFADWTVRLLLEAVPGHQPREVIVPGTLHAPPTSEVPPSAAGPKTATL